MAYVTAEARQQLLDTVAEATNEIGIALTALGDAYEQLDEQSADRLEAELFRPVQVAYGRAKRTHSDFAGRYGLPTRTFEPARSGLASRGVKGLLEAAVEAVAEAEFILTELQDSMMPVEVGDPEVRAGIAEVRTLAGALSAHAAQFVSRFGR